VPEVKRDRVRELPDAYGCYFMKNEAGEVLYIGKASSLKKRVASYFIGRRHPHPRTRQLVKRIAKVAYIETRSEIEALLLEANLIHEYRPPYNVELKDDKSYPMLKLTMGDRYPRLVITRNRRDKKAFYYGPYTDVRILRRAVSYLKRIFPLRSCKRVPRKVCLEYHLAQCTGPCEFPEVESSYRRITKELDLFLKGQGKEVIRQLKARMRMAASQLAYEEAARLRDRMHALEEMMGQTRALNAATALEELRIHLGLGQTPHQIYGFDISNIQGRAAVGSRIAFLDGRPDKAHYRRFRIKKVQGIDDYAMMKEVLQRSFYSRKGKDPIPDLILIDGGQGQLNAAREVLHAMKRNKLPVVGLAKREEEIYRWNRSGPLRLSRRSKALQLLQQVRDEAHRFAITYHKNLRQKAMVASKLDDIVGIGPSLKKKLMTQFGTLEAIRHATREQLTQVPGVNHPLAETILDILHTE
jgi:excinuclease ABC subunit C